MTDPTHDSLRTTVRDRYARIAVTDGAGCGCTPTCCDTAPPKPETMSLALGYSTADLLAVPEGANLGLGCGNPRAIAALKPGETVLDLGSGAGFDAFLAARQVGEMRRVIGVDMTPEMLEAAGFAEIRVTPKDESRSFIRDWAPGTCVEDWVRSATVEAVKPFAGPSPSA